MQEHINSRPGRSFINILKEKMYLSNIDIVMNISDKLFEKYIFKPWYSILANEMNSIMKGNNIIDIGYGQWPLTFELIKYKKEYNITGIDISSKADKHVNTIKNKQDLKNIEFIAVHNNEIPFNKKYFSSGFSIFSFHSWKNPVIILNEIYRVMSRDSIFVIVDFNGEEKYEKENTEYLNRQVGRTPGFLKYLIKKDINWGYKIAGLYIPGKMKEIIEKSKFSHYKIKKRALADSDDNFIIEAVLKK